MDINALPTIEHSDVALNERDRVVVQMQNGWKFYRLDIFPDEAPTRKEAYSKFGVFPREYDFSNIVVVAESKIPETSETPETPEEPAPATEEDYINALEELGVNFNG